MAQHEDEYVGANLQRAEPGEGNGTGAEQQRCGGSRWDDGGRVAGPSTGALAKHSSEAGRAGIPTAHSAPVKQVVIPKPDGGERLLGIPTVQDRLIQQAMHQVLSEEYEPKFSDHSYGFRPGRSAHDAVRKAQGYVEDGNKWVVDMDLAKFFDTVNPVLDRLMSRLKRDIEDKRVLWLVNQYLKAGVMVNGVVVETRRRDAARRSTVAAAIEHRAG